MSQNLSLTRAGVTVAIAALLTAVIAAATSLLLTSRLSNEDALLSDMETIVETVSDEAVANTESFLRPADQTADFLSSFITDGVFDPDGPTAYITLLDVLQSNASFDGIFVGSADGRFIYVNRPADESTVAYETKRISFPNGQRTVEIGTYDRSLEQLSSELDAADSFDPRNRVWYEETLDAEGPAWTDPYLFFSSGLPGVTRTKPVYSGEVIEHVVGVDIRIAALSDFMADRAPSPNGAAFVMTKTQLMVAYPDLDAIGDGAVLRYASDVDDTAVMLAGASIERDADDEEMKQSETVDLDGTNAHFVFTELETNGDWVVTAWSPHSDFLAEIRGTAKTNRVIAIGLGVVIFIELLVAAAWVLRQLSSNHRRLAESQAAIVQSSIDRDRAELELAETVDKLAASNRDLEEYAYAAAHDLRTPLRAIGGYSELIGREVESDDADLGRIREWSDRIVTGYDRMGRTMDNLLEHARLSRLGLDHVNLERVETRMVAESVASDLTSLLDEVGGEVLIGDLPVACADPLQISRVFQNLLENSIRFRDDERPLRIEIDGAIDGDLVRFTVADNGVGISGIDRSRIFDSFRSAHEKSSGVGLGLALVKRIVEDHGGEITVWSEVDQGTRFEFTLPSEFSTTPDGTP